MHANQILFLASVVTVVVAAPNPMPGTALEARKEAKGASAKASATATGSASPAKTSGAATKKAGKSVGGGQAAASGSTAGSTADKKSSASKQSDSKSGGGSVDKKIPSPKAGQCALLTYSADVLPIGGVPTSVDGGGIAPSEEGSPYIEVINSKRQIVGTAGLKPQSPGFKASVQLDKSGTKNGGTLTVTAGGIAVGDGNWGIEFDYGGKHTKCTGNPACNNVVHLGSLNAIDVHWAPFDC